MVKRILSTRNDLHRLIKETIENEQVPMNGKSSEIAKVVSEINSVYKGLDHILTLGDKFYANGGAQLDLRYDYREIPRCQPFTTKTAYDVLLQAFHVLEDIKQKLENGTNYHTVEELGGEDDWDWEDYYSDEKAPNESVSRKVTESVLRKLHEWNEMDNDLAYDEEEESIWDSEPTVTSLVDAAKYMSAKEIFDELVSYLSRDQEEELIDDMVSEGSPREKYLSEYVDYYQCDPILLLQQADNYFGTWETGRWGQEILHNLWGN